MFIDNFPAIKNFSIDDTRVFANEKYEGIVFKWSASIGFGELTLYKETGTNEWKADTECMCKDDDKDFIQTVLNEWIDKMKVTE